MVELNSVRVWPEGDLLVVGTAIWVRGVLDIPTVVGVDAGDQLFLIRVHRRLEESGRILTHPGVGNK